MVEEAHTFWQEQGRRFSKAKALGAEVGCKNALFVAGAQATNKIVPMPQTVCRGISAPILTPGFATFSLSFLEPPHLCLRGSVCFTRVACREVQGLTFAAGCKKEACGLMFSLVGISCSLCSSTPGLMKNSCKNEID